MKAQSNSANPTKRVLAAQREANQSNVKAAVKAMLDERKEQSWEEGRSSKLEALVKQCLELGFEVQVVLDEDFQGLLQYRFDKCDMAFMNNTLSLACEEWEYQVFTSDVTAYVTAKEEARVKEEKRQEVLSKLTKEEKELLGVR